MISHAARDIDSLVRAGQKSINRFVPGKSYLSNSEQLGE